MRTILTKKELMERWGVDYKTLDRYEEEGYIKRLNLPGVRYSLASIEAVESDGTDNLLIKKDRQIRELQAELNKYRNKFDEIRGVIDL